MDFFHIDHNLSSHAVDAAKKEFSRLLTELALSDCNNFITGMGGNNFQLMVLLGMKHILEDSDDIVVSDNEMIWGAKLLTNTNANDMRYMLTHAFDDILERNKYSAIALLEVSKSRNMRETVLKYANQFPVLNNAMSNKMFAFDGGMSIVDQYIAACIMCQELSFRLDADDFSTVQSTAYSMSEFPTEIALYAMRAHIGLARFIKKQLDDDPIFNKILRNISKLLCR